MTVSTRINMSDYLINKINYDVYLFKNTIWDRDQNRYIEDREMGFAMYQCNLTITVSGKGRMEEFEACLNDVLGYHYATQHANINVHQFAGHRKRYGIYMKLVPDYIDPLEAKEIARSHSDYISNYIFVPYHELSDAANDDDRIFDTAKQVMDLINRMVGPCWQ